MNGIVLVTGGARSGKSAWAERRAEACQGARVYVATCAPCDDEMRARVARHRERRAGRGWATLEEPLDLAGALRRAAGEYAVALVDCLTVWIANRMYAAEQSGAPLTEEEVAEESGRIVDACQSLSQTAVLVTGEVGLGIVPDNPVARRFRDLLGVCNQTVAARASEVTLLVCGQPLRIK
jgi:adenosylcobinamide kinase/adenosylcobinamide-phosphate guanylyltransferase